MLWWIVIPWLVAVVAGLGACALFNRSEGASIALTILTICATVAALVMSIGLPLEQKGCDRMGDSLGVPVVYEVVGGCYAQIDDRLVPTENLRFVDNAGNLVIEIDSDN